MRVDATERKQIVEQVTAPQVGWAPRVGILTYHHVVNEGALLQAYALSRGLQAQLKPAEVEIVDYRPFRVELRDAKNLMYAFADLRRGLNSARAHRTLGKFSSTALALSKRRLVSDSYERALRFIDGAYDAVVVGSDEVWKIREGFFHRRFPNVYWLSPDLTCKKIAFAVSANKTLYRRLSAEQRAWIAKTLGGFDLIGVRDSHTMAFMDWLGIRANGKVSRVPDPTFLLDLDGDEVRDVLGRLGVSLDRPILGTVLNNRQMSKDIAVHFRAKGFQVVAMSFYNRYADVNLVGKLTPLEWAKAFRYFTACVTDRFHGTVLSLKHGTPVVTIDHFDAYDESESKNVSLLEEFGLLHACHLNAKTRGFSTAKACEKLEQVMRTFDGEATRNTAQAKQHEGLRFIEKIKRVIGDEALR